jgi:hypothetical protein
MNDVLCFDTYRESKPKPMSKHWPFGLHSRVATHVVCNFTGPVIVRDTLFLNDLVLAPKLLFGPGKSLVYVGEKLCGGGGLFYPEHGGCCSLE